MRTLTRVSLLAAALFLLVGAGQCLAAGGTKGASAEEAQHAVALSAAQAAVAQARLDAARQAVAEAEVRLKAVQEELEVARRRVAEGTASNQNVREAEVEVAAVETALLKARAGLAEVQASVARRVTLALADADIRLVLAKLFENSGRSYIMDPNITDSRPATITLNNVEFEKALVAVCEAAGLQHENHGGVWVFSKRSDMATIGGFRWPVVGAMPMPGTESPEVKAPGLPTPSPPAVRQRRPFAPRLQGLPGGQTLIDLDVKQAPLGVVISQIAGAVQGELDKEASKQPSQQKQILEMHVEGPAKDIAVTARIYRWPAQDVMNMLLDQTGLDFQAEWMGSTYGLYLVPKPTLEVTEPDGTPLKVETLPPGLTGRLPGRVTTPNLPSQPLLVDLDVRNAPLSEVARQIAAAAQAELDKESAEQRAPRYAVRINVHDSVKDLRVTASIYRWPAQGVLSMLMDQTGLESTAEERAPSDTQPGSYTLYLVPKPMLSVSGVAQPYEGRVRRQPAP